LTGCPDGSARALFDTAVTRWLSDADRYRGPAVKVRAILGSSA
jgi:hypothetical protein